LDVGVVNAGS